MNLTYLHKGLSYGAILCFLFCNFSVFAQDWHVLNEEVLTEIKNGEYILALEKAKYSRDLAEDQFGNAHANYICSLHNLASARFMLGQTEEARSIYLQSIKIAAAKYGQDLRVYTIWQIFIKIPGDTMSRKHFIKES